MLLPDSKTELVRRGNKVVYDLGDKIVKVFNETKPVSDVFNEALNLARINRVRHPQPQGSRGFPARERQRLGARDREGSGHHPCPRR